MLRSVHCELLGTGYIANNFDASPQRGVRCFRCDAFTSPCGRSNAVVNRASKYALKADYVNRRSCRVPPSRYIQAEFKGDSAKLRWPVSLDGTKFQTETYKIIAVRP